MAVNESRSMSLDFHQGSIDRTYIQVDPDRSGGSVGKDERLSWPTYLQAEQHADHPFWESMLGRADLPRETRTHADVGDPRY